MVTLQLDDVGAYYGKRLAVSGVSTPVMTAGEIVAVIGPNAAGKSTLFKRIAGLLKGPGQVRVNDSKKDKKAISYMPQDTSANAVLTVYESILLARKQGSAWSVDDDDLQLIDHVMAALNIVPIAFRDLGALSGGQRQLVSVAQTLVREPDILLMDEPTSALDLRHQDEFMRTIREVAATDTIVVVILHELGLAARMADRIAVLSEGRIVVEGPPEMAFTSGTLADVWGIDADVTVNARGTLHIDVLGPARARLSQEIG